MIEDTVSVDCLIEISPHRTPRVMAYVHEAEVVGRGNTIDEAVEQALAGVAACDDSQPELPLVFATAAAI